MTTNHQDDRCRPESLDRLDVVVVVHRCAPSLVDRSFAALHEALGDRWQGRLVVVENRPAPATSAAARKAARRFSAATVVIVRCRRNLGFGGGVNLGVSRTTAPFVGTFNPDGVARPDTVHLLVDALERDADAFMAGPRIAPPVKSAPPAPAPPAAPVEVVDFVPGTAVVFRRDRFLDLGGFDPLYFMYMEDTDLSLRARQRWHLLHVPAAVFHHGRPARRWAELPRARQWTVSAMSFTYRWRRTRRGAIVVLSWKRTSALIRLARQRSWVRLAGTTMGLLAWPARLPRAERRRQHPWSTQSLERWLASVAPLVAEKRAR